MKKALRAFEDKAYGSEVAVLYYSGHGIEVNGDNFLIPVDAKLASDRDVKYETILLDDDVPPGDLDPTGNHDVTDATADKGCACSTAGHTPGAPRSLSLLAVGLALTARRRRSAR